MFDTIKSLDQTKLCARTLDFAIAKKGPAGNITGIKPSRPQVASRVKDTRQYPNQATDYTNNLITHTLKLEPDPTLI